MKKYSNPKKQIWDSLCNRPNQSLATLEQTVKEVFEQVKIKGDQALIELTEKFDNVSIDSIKITNEAVEQAIKIVDNKLKKAIILAKENIEKFHNSQKLVVTKIETRPGVICWQEARPIENVGLYIPGGTAPLFSTVLMLAVPAMLAKCKEILLFSPPDHTGNINPIILYTASLCGIKKIYKVGGIQAIAAMSLGTKTIQKVAKIFGPGNQYVTAAKQYAQQIGVAIDMPAGPSELLVFADQSANAAFIAADLLSQAEHGNDSQVVCVSNSQTQIDQVIEEIQTQIKKLPRKEIANQALTNARFICFEKDEQAISFINQYAAEHLIISKENAEIICNKINNAGSIFIGNYAPESAGDYASGTNHTLPTNGFAKTHSGLNLDAFTKKITFQQISPEGLQNIGPSIEIMAENEQLLAHKLAVSIRLNQINQ